MVAALAIPNCNLDIEWEAIIRKAFAKPIGGEKWTDIH
jgi:hypothetical protein